jgi:hypothetical protein
MNVFYGNSKSRRRTARFATCMLVLAASVAAARAQTPPYLEFQYSTITGSGNTITATRLPVVLSTGTSYVDVVIEFDVAANGTITVAPGYPTVVAAPAQLTSNFLAGSYTGPSTDGNYDMTVFGPGVTAGGATEWSLAATGSASCATAPNSATWYVFSGPMTKNPLYPRLSAAKISTTTYQAYGGWGTTGSQSCTSTGWQTNTLIGLSQTGSALMITSFTNSAGDQDQPVSEITYVKQ